MLTRRAHLRNNWCCLVILSTVISTFPPVYTKRIIVSVGIALVNLMCTSTSAVNILNEQLATRVDHRVCCSCEQSNGLFAATDSDHRKGTLPKPIQKGFQMLLAATDAAVSISSTSTCEINSADAICASTCIDSPADGRTSRRMASAGSKN